MKFDQIKELIPACFGVDDTGDIFVSVDICNKDLRTLAKYLWLKATLYYLSWQAEFFTALTKDAMVHRTKQPISYAMPAEFKALLVSLCETAEDTV